MKRLLLSLVTLSLLSVSSVATAEELIASAKEFRQYEAQINAAREAAFNADLKEQQAALAEAKRLLKDEQAKADKLKAQFANNEEQLTKDSEALRLRTGSLGEMFGVVRQVANDLKSTTSDSILRTNTDNTRTQMPADLDALASSKKLPELSDLKALWQTLRQEAKLSAEITEFNAPVMQLDGTTRTDTLVRIGVFNVVDRQGYWLWDEQLEAFRTLARQPSEAGLIANYLSSNEDISAITIDPSRGALLSINSITPAWSERIQQGGTVGYIIIALGFIGVCLALWRLVTLAVIEKGVRQQLIATHTPANSNPLGRILNAGSADIENTTNAELLEARLDEAVLKELPAIERGQGIIKLLAGVAPLLGLLGTVTGMIATFQAITAFGSGDAKLMASGISQALITTVLGLVVAIPLLLMHSWVASRSRTLVQILDEQSAGLIAQSLEKTAPKNSGKPS
jgi:biopolymer transport protein ExbB